MYPYIPDGVEPSLEWYKPKIKKHMSAAVKDHILRGGLLLRKLEPRRVTGGGA